MSAGTVIIGAGQAGQQVAESLRSGGYDAPVTLIGEEPHTPYQLPPLSKGYLKGTVDRARLAFRAPAWYTDNAVELRLNSRVDRIDPSAQQVQLREGISLSYEHLVIATGSRPFVPPLPGIDSDRVCYMRTLDDADRFVGLVEKHQRFAVLGAGFIGLEAAASLRQFGKDVTVIEAADRVMARVVSPAMSAYAADLHAGQGVELITGAFCTGITQTPEGLTLTLSTGTPVECDILLAGVGAIPNTELAEAAGIACDRGILVDSAQRTDISGIWAAGDCCMQESVFAGGPVRLESVQNAMDQAKVIAANILGKEAENTAVPWFWSDQFDLKYQMAGLGAPQDELVTIGDPAGGRFSVVHFAGGMLRAVESANQPGEHMATRQLLALTAPVTRAEFDAAGQDLKALFKARR